MVGREDPAPWGGSWIMDLCAEEGRGIGTRLFRWAEEMGGEYLWTVAEPCRDSIDRRFGVFGGQVGFLKMAEGARMRGYI